MDELGNYIEVPEEFWSFETGKPLAACRLCGKDLMMEGTNYLIEKAFRNDETIFEHAMCLDCYAKCHESMSDESKIRIRDYFAEHVDMKQRDLDLLERHGTDHSKWLGHCMVKGYPLAECGEYQIYGYCIDKDLVFSGAPYALSGEVIEEILELLSPQTLGVMKDLSAKLFGIDAPKDLLVF